MRSLPSPLLGILLAFLMLMSGCDSGGTYEDSGEPGPVSVSSITVSPAGVTTVNWTEYSAENFGSYVVYRSAAGTPGLQRVTTIASKRETRFRNRPLGFVGGTLQYRVDVRTTDGNTLTGETAERQTSAPNVSVEVTSDSTVHASWSPCPYPDAFVGYSIQRLPSSSLSSFRGIEFIEDISDTTTTVKTSFGRVDDYRVVTRSQIFGRSVAGTPALRVGIGTSFPPHTQIQYAPSRNELYALNEASPSVLRLDAESLARKDSASLSLSLSRRANYAFRIEEETSNLQQIDPTSFAVTNTLSASSLPQFDPDRTPEEGIQVLETGRLLYTAYADGTQAEVTVYDFQNETLVGQTEEGVPASVLSTSYSGNYAVVETDEPTIYDVGGDEVRRIGAVPEYNSSHFHWIESPTNAEDQFATYASGTITIRRAQDLSRVRQFSVDGSLTHLGHDPETGSLWGTDESANQLYVFSAGSGSVFDSIPIVNQNAERFAVTSGYAFYEEGRRFKLTLPI